MTTTETAKDLNGAPYKIVPKGGKFQVVNNLGVVKATFDSEKEARQYQKALYANVPGAAKVASNKPWTGTAKRRSAAAEGDGEMIDGDDVSAKALASGVDAALDAATQLVSSNDPSALPGWAQQVCSLVISAGETVDELLEAMGVDDPDEGMPNADTVKAAENVSYMLGSHLGMLRYLQRARDFSADERKKLAASGKAMSDGSYPIENADDLKNALLSFGRAGNKDAVKVHIKKRAAGLGLSSKLPDDWK